MNMSRNMTMNMVMNMHPNHSRKLLNSNPTLALALHLHLA